MSFRGGDLVNQYPEVKRWIDAVTTKQATRDLYLSGMQDFIDFSGLTPGEMLRIKKEALKQGDVRTLLEDKLVEWIRARQRKYSQNAIAAGVTAVRSFLGSYGYLLPKKFAQIGGKEPLALREPEFSEVEAMIGYTHDLDKKALISMMAECPCRPRVFIVLKWGWLEEGWESKDVAQIILPREFRPMKSGARKFEPIAFLGKRSIELLKRLKMQRGAVKPEDRIFPYSKPWFRKAVERVFQRCIREKEIRPSRSDEQSISLKSFRKYVFNAIDACRDISPEWRSMLKGRDLGVEKYYSKENIERLREVYRTRVYPEIWQEKPSLDEWQVQYEAAKRVLLAQGIDADRLLKKYPSIIELQDKAKFLDEQIKLLGLESGKRKRTERNGGKPFESRIISEDELTAFLDEGWDLVKELSNGKIVIRRPLETG